jgi:hypothetical protein
MKPGLSSQALAPARPSGVLRDPQYNTRYGGGAHAEVQLVLVAVKRASISRSVCAFAIGGT